MFKKVLKFVVSKIRVLLIVIFRFLKRCIRAIHRKKRLAIPFYSVITYILLVILIIKISGDKGYDQAIPDKRVNDVTAINPIQVSSVIQPQTTEEIIAAIKSTNGPISIGGGRFSMGGQIGYENSLHIDMRKFNKVLHLDTINKQVSVQPGIVWRDLQRVIDQHDLSIKI